jgi:hypothetical protein
MQTEWDPAKAKANLRKHRVRFADAVTALEDTRAISVRDEGAGEERWITIGMDPWAAFWWLSTLGARSGFG